MLQTRGHLVNPSIPGLGQLCVLHPLRPSITASSSPYPPYIQRDTDRVWLGRAVASPRCARSSAYLESICLLPLTDPEPAGLSAAPLSVPYGLGWRGAKGGGSGRCRAGEGESGLGITVPKYASFFIFVFLKKYRLCYQEEEE